MLFTALVLAAAPPAVACWDVPWHGEQSDGWWEAQQQAGRGCLWDDNADPYEFPFIEVRVPAWPANHNAYAREDAQDLLTAPWPRPNWQAHRQPEIDVPPVQPRWPPEIYI